MTITPTLELERELFSRGIKFVAGVDEVGRGAIAGPVTIGIAVITNVDGDFPTGLRDSKLLSKIGREKILPSTVDWVTEYALGSATALEIDEVGIVPAMRLAFTRAYEQLAIKPDHVILDGKHNWIGDQFEVTMKVKADAHCAVVSAASVLAKVSRDNEMAQLHELHPAFGWSSNVGYGAARHLEAIRQLGATEYHRRSWNLPTRL